ncbi:GABA-specific high-affinity permease, partial [Linnemannia exigua]
MTLGRPLGTSFVAMILTGIFFTGLNRLSIASRVAYAFSRDGGLPKSSYWNHLQTRRKTPQRVSWLVTAACISGIFPFYWGD